VLKSVLVLCFVCVTFASAHAAQPATCQEAADQPARNACERQAFEVADAELAMVLGQLKARATEDDALEGPEVHTTVDALAASQAAWLVFRDAECRWQSMAAAGDAIQPMLVSICATKLTRQRMRQLEIGVSE
jgi:uncharacterized protein YecT (DUF1311 family)